MNIQQQKNNLFLDSPLFFDDGFFFSRGPGQTGAGVVWLCRRPRSVPAAGQLGGRQPDVSHATRQRHVRARGGARLRPHRTDGGQGCSGGGRGK